MNQHALTLLLLLLLELGCKSPLRPLFSYSSDSSSRTSLVPTQDSVVFGTESGAVIRLNFYGEQVWRAELGAEVAGTPAVTADAVIAATVEGGWVGFAARTGKEIWRLSAQPPVFTPIVSDGYRAFLVAQDGSVWALDSATGAVLWKRPAPKEFRTSKERRAFPRPVLSEERLIVALREGGVIGLEPSSGKQVWTLSTRNIVGLTRSRDHLIAVTSVGKVSVLALKNGATVWQVAIGSSAISEASLALGYVWVGLENNELVALSSETGRELWRTVMPGPVTSAVVAYDHLLLVPTDSSDGILRGVNPGRSRPVLEARLDSNLRSPPITFSNRFLILSRDGRVFGFQVVE